ncbi:cytochrome P450 [Lentinula raphanica]|uniref:Cytochrome P450 n=1 Tax=Lentinula raphanica TaxID=153919 RepID=A0AA38U8P6_9AGAR|nr:cytochrome P450 [Lentinula raphanica]
MSISLQRLAMPVMVVTILTFTYLIFSKRRQRPNKTLLHPPGPPASEMPAENAWIKFQQWGKEYGELVYLQEKNILILNTSRVVNDLLEKRASNYSDRQITPMIELSGIHNIFSIAVRFFGFIECPENKRFELAFMKRFSDEWRRDRKLFLHNFRPATIDRFHPHQYDKVHNFLRHLASSPHEFMQHTIELSQSLVLSSVYGLDVRSDDPLIKMAMEALELIDEVMNPGSFPVIERFPWLYYFPSWFPGCRFKKVAGQCSERIEKMNTVPFDMAMENQVKGLKSSMIAELAIQHQGDPEMTQAVRRMGLLSYAAAADTTMSSISSFLLSMCLHPDIQRKGQEEIDRVIGQDRLPTFEDRWSLPYVVERRAVW